MQRNEVDFPVQIFYENFQLWLNLGVICFADNCVTKKVLYNPLAYCVFANDHIKCTHIIK